MTLALSDLHGLHPDAASTDAIVPPPAGHRAAAIEDVELLLSAILPDARVEPAGRAHDADLRVAAPRDAFDEALGVLCEAGFVPRSGDSAAPRHALLVAPQGVALRLVESPAPARVEPPADA